MCDILDIPGYLVTMILEKRFFCFSYLDKCIMHCKIKTDNNQVPKIVGVPGNKTNPKKIRIKIYK